VNLRYRKCPLQDAHEPEHEDDDHDGDDETDDAAHGSFPQKLDT
jgi:hypothetical protein